MELDREEKHPAGSILRELVFNQYQAILLGGVALASLVTLNPIPIATLVGLELVTLPLLDSGPMRRLLARRRRAKALEESRRRRKDVLGSFRPEYARRYAALEELCRRIETNYQGLHGISQTFLSEQRGKLDVILDGCLQRMTALQRYEKTLSERTPESVEKEITTLERELADPELNERARTAIEKNLELKRRLLDSYEDAIGTTRALSTELDSMASLLEVLHQSSISMRDPDAIADELDTIVRQSEDSQRAVREMESLLREGVSAGDSGRFADEAEPVTPREGTRTPRRGRVRDQ